MHTCELAPVTKVLSKMQMDKKRFKKMFPHLTKEMNSEESRVAIDSVRSDIQTGEKKVSPDKSVGFTPDVIDFLRRCDNEQQAKEIIDYLKKQRDVYKYIHDQTLRLANHGYTMLEAAEQIELPESLAQTFATRGYYGTVNHNAKAVYQHYFGWFDGNPSNLFPLNPREEAERVAKLAGGEDALLEAAKEAMAENDPQWAAQLCDHLLALNPNAKESMLLKADALEAIAETVLSGIGRNYYLTVAQELRQAAK